MPDKLVQLPDGRVVAFPDSMSDDEISAAIRADLSGTQGRTLQRQPSFLEGINEALAPRQFTPTGEPTTTGGKVFTEIERLTGSSLAAEIGRRLTDLNPVLNPRESAKAVGRALMGPVNLGRALFAPPETPEEATAAAMSPQFPQAGVILRRLAIAPTEQGIREVTDPNLDIGSRVRGGFRAIPVVGALGAAMGEAEEKAGLGSVLAEQGANIAMGGATTAGLRRLTMRAPKSFVDAGKELFDAVKPSKAVRMRAKDDLPGATQDIADFANTFGVEVDSVLKAQQTATMAKRVILEDINKLTQGQGVTGSGSTIAGAIRTFKSSRKVKAFKEGTGEVVEQTPPGLKDPTDLIDEYIEFYEGKNFPLDELENLRRGENARMSAFMRKNQIKQGQEARANPATATQLEVIAALEQEIDNALSRIKSPGAKDLRKRYSQLRTAEDVFLDRYITDLVDAGHPFDSLDTITAGSSVTALALGQPEAAGTLAGTVFARRAITFIREKYGNPDRLVRKAFEDVESGQFRRVSPPRRRLLGAPSELITPESQRQPIPAAGERPLRSLSGQR